MSSLCEEVGTATVVKEWHICFIDKHLHDLPLGVDCFVHTLLTYAPNNVNGFDNEEIRRELMMIMDDPSLSEDEKGNAKVLFNSLDLVGPFAHPAVDMTQQTKTIQDLVRVLVEKQCKANPVNLK